MNVRGRIQRAQREGAWRLYWSDNGYSDFATADEAFATAAQTETSARHVVRLNHEVDGDLDSDYLKRLIQIHRSGQTLYEAVRLHPDMSNVPAKLAVLEWNGENAVFSFLLDGSRIAECVTADDLLNDSTDNLADSLVNWAVRTSDQRSSAR